MINKAKTENGKKKEIKANEKPKLKVGKKVKEKADKIVKKKKKLKKKESEGFESNKEPQSLLKDSGNIKVYIDDDFVKANGNLIAKSNAILGKYENSLDKITGFIQNTLEELEDCKCIYDI